MPDGPNANDPTPAVNAWHWIAYALIILVLVILAGNGAWFISSNHISDPKVFIAITLTSLFVLATTTTLAIIFLWGAKVLDLDKTFMNWLGGATVAEVAGILTIIVNFYFAKPTPAPQNQPPTQAVQQQSDSAPPQQPPQQVQAPPKTTPAPSSQTAPQPQ